MSAAARGSRAVAVAAPGRVRARARHRYRTAASAAHRARGRRGRWSGRRPGPSAGRGRRRPRRRSGRGGAGPCRSTGPAGRGRGRSAACAADGRAAVARDALGDPGRTRAGGGRDQGGRHSPRTRRPEPAQGGHRSRSERARRPRRHARPRVGELVAVAVLEREVAEGERVDPVIDEVRDPFEVPGRLGHLPAAPGAGAPRGPRGGPGSGR